MLMRATKSNDLIRVDHVEDLINPFEPEVSACNQAGEEEQEAVNYCKSAIAFPSGEGLPRCWTDPNYRVE